MTATTGTPPPEVSGLVARMRSGELVALARALTELERLSPAAPKLIADMAPYLGHAQVVGFTGPPGAGKSTLVNAYVRQLRADSKSVGVIAIDPSSPVSGGALLGDRVRMNEHTGDDGVFIRSLASRGHVGGLTPAAVRMIDVFDAAGKDVVILETVGAGQSEIDVAEVADIRIVLSAPGLGDDIQAMKSGILEIADILVVNKADLPGAEKTCSHLQSAISLSATKSAIGVFKTVATTGEGVGELVEQVGAVAAASTDTPLDRRRKRARRLLAWAATDLIEKRLRDRTDPKIGALCDDILSGSATPGQAADKLLKGS